MFHFKNLMRMEYSKIDNFDIILGDYDSNALFMKIVKKTKF